MTGDLCYVFAQVLHHIAMPFINLAQPCKSLHTEEYIYGKVM